MNGHEVATEIKRMRPELIIILLSAYEVPMHALAGVEGFIRKFEAPRQLLPMIAQLCRQTHRQGHASGA